MPSESGFLITILEPSVLDASKRRVAPPGSLLLIRLSIFNPSRRQVDKISCCLKGVCTVWFTINEGAPGYETFTRNIDYSFPALNSVREVQQESIVQTWFETFTFRLPESSSLPMREFPPTIHTKCSTCCCQKDKRSPNGNGGRVTYTLRIGLWIGEQIVAAYAEELVLSPSATPSPPICVQDFPRDYKVVQAKISRNVFARTRKVLELSVVEPDPLIYNPKTDVLHTKLRFSITYEDIKVPYLENPSLAMERCEVELSLKAKTVISLNPLQAQPTASQIRHSPYLSEIFQEYASKIRTLNLPAWTEVRWEDNRDDNGHRICQKVLKFSVDFWQEHCGCLAPTFSSPLMLRRYSLAAVVTLYGESIQKFRLEMPVQICAEYKRSEEDGPSEDNRQTELGDEVEQLPSYLPWQ